MGLMKKKDLDDVLVFAGGIIPEEDVSSLVTIGIRQIFGPGTKTETVVAFVRDNVTSR
jgi:methylmalonyl-CoA mutase C-terminal domain/subunit